MRCNMTLSTDCAQAGPVHGARDLAPQCAASAVRRVTSRSAMGLLQMAVPAMMPARRPRLCVPAAATHRQPALLTDLRVFCAHACGDLGSVRNELRTKPHRIGRAELLDATPLSPGTIEQQHTCQQGWPESQVNDPHQGYFPLAAALAAIWCSASGRLLAERSGGDSKRQGRHTNGRAKGSRCLGENCC